MEFWCVLTGSVFLIVLFPYLRCFFKRLICSKKIKKECQRNGFRLYATHPLWFLGNRRGKICDLYIEAASEVFSIKLFGMPRRSISLVLKENGDYFIRSFIIFIYYGKGLRYQIDHKPKPLPTYDFQYQYKEEWKNKTLRKILLLHPVSMEVCHQPQHGGEKILCAGDQVGGMEIASLPHLLNALKSS